MGRKEFRISTMASPVGYTAYPLTVGAKGFTFITDFLLAF